MMARHKTRNARRKQWRRYQRHLAGFSGVRQSDHLFEAYWLRMGQRVPAWWRI